MEQNAPLRIPDEADLEFSVSLALRLHGLGKKNKPPDELTAQIIAQAVIKSLRRSNYVILQKPPLEAHGTPQKV